MISEEEKLWIASLDTTLLFPILVMVLVQVFNQIIGQVDYEFIDEVFHVTQCQLYCKEMFSVWDPKITTPPGLYWLGYLYLKSLGWVIGTDMCGLTQLRSLNYVGGVWVLPFILKYVLKSYPEEGFPLASLVSFPLLTIYYCLFYTDVWSTVLVVIGVVAALQNNVIVSSLIGLVSMSFRQTNLVWNLFMLAIIVDNKLRLQYKGDLYTDILHFIKVSMKSWLSILPFVLNVALFCGFVFVNGGVTFGDKENHIAGFHLAQLFYCCTFMTFFSGPIWFSPSFISNYVRQNFKSPSRLVRFIFSCGVIALIIDRFTITHPFLLADNRHYIFYLWKRVIDRTSYSRYLLTPVYHFSISCVLGLMKRPVENAFSFSRITILAFCFCVCLSIIPSPLFEPRYYILPFLIWRMMIRPVEEPVFPVFDYYNRTIRLCLEFIMFSVINVITFYVFLNYTFEWESEPGFPQRIIW